MSQQKQSTPSKGLFITLEGGEGSGKTTLGKGLIEALEAKGLPVVSTREPGGCPLGDEIRNLLLHGDHITKRAELFLFLASRAEHVETKIMPALAAGKVVVCDRFTDSTLAYQVGARELKLDSFCAYAAHDLVPDLTFFLDVDPEISYERIKQMRPDRIENEGMSFHKKVVEAFRDLANEEPNRIHRIDGTLSPELVLEKALVALNVKLGEKLCLL